MIQYLQLKAPKKETDFVPVPLSDQTLHERKIKVLARMKEEGYDAIVIYGDLEHGSNFEYLSGFVPRFEEALLILHNDGQAYMVLGNENLNKAGKSRIAVHAIHLPHFSLPNQPMKPQQTVTEVLSKCGLDSKKDIGLVGWKHFTSKVEENALLFDLPYFIVEALKETCDNANFSNATYLFIGEDGVRCSNNANEIAHYEFGAALAGSCIMNAMDAMEVGKTEMEVATFLEAYGQPHSVVTIMATGERFEKANLYPGNKPIKLGDKISLTTGFKGGLQSRGGYAVSNVTELPEKERDYLDRVAIPYFNAVKTWLETIQIGMKGKDLYAKIEEALPTSEYGWSLNPGHLCADEEWLSSPIYPQSNEVLKSGMIFQIDIIPSVSGYAGASCESGIVLADEHLREEIKKAYPQMWERIQTRRNYLIEELGIRISEEVLPTSAATAYYRPFFLNKRHGLASKAI
jgi:Xaa-Pro aminopeptidase